MLQKSVVGGVCTLALLAGAPAFAQNNVMLIFDASGSMKRDAGAGASRIQVAKGAVSQTLSTMPGSVRLGLMAFGHRQRKECRDIELVSPIGADSPQTLGRVVSNFPALGETPIADALDAAGKSFAAFKGQQNSIILVTDGVEECGGDPCAAAQRLAALGVNLKVNIVGFTLSEQQRQALHCITDATGGTFYPAENTTALQRAMQQVKEAVAQPAVQVVAQPTPRPIVRPAENVRYRVVYSESGEPVKSNLDWIKFFKPEKTGELGQETIKYTENGYLHHAKPTGAFKLNPGPWRVTAFSSNGPAMGSLDIELGADDTKDIVINLNAGVGAFKLFYDSGEGAEEVKAKVEWWRLYRKVTKRELGREKIEYKEIYYRHALTGPQTIVMNAGDYRIEAVVGDAKNSTDFTIAAGRALERAVNLDAGHVKINVVGPDGQPLAATWWGIDRKMMDTAAGETEPTFKEATYRYAVATENSFTLNSGKYRIRLKFETPGLPATASATFEVTAGQATDVRVEVAAN